MPLCLFSNLSFKGNIICWGGVAKVAIATISDQTRRDKFVKEAFKGAQYSWGSWKSDGFMHEGGSYFNYAVENLILFRQLVMEASDGKNDFFLTNPNVDKMMAFAFEYPMSGLRSAQFSDDKVGEIKDDVRKYIELTYSPNPISSFDISVNWLLVGQALRYSLIIEPKNRYPVQNKTLFATGIRKYYEESEILICRPTVVNGLAASFKLLGGSSAISGNHNHDGYFFFSFAS